MPRRLAGVLPTAAALLFVLTAYAFFGSTGTWEFRRVDWPESFYAGQIEGFLLGQLSLRHEPDPALAKLANPYEMSSARGSCSRGTRATTRAGTTSTFPPSPRCFSRCRSSWWGRATRPTR
jgi:hypothetical protein